jgi:hypothetical protein
LFILNGANKQGTNKENNTQPTQDFYKVNCDANLTSDGVWGIGTTIRNETGALMAAATWTVQGFYDAATTEAFTM